MAAYSHNIHKLVKETKYYADLDEIDQEAILTDHLTRIDLLVHFVRTRDVDRFIEDYAYIPHVTEIVIEVHQNTLK